MDALKVYDLEYSLTDLLKPPSVENVLLFYMSGETKYQDNIQKTYFQDWLNSCSSAPQLPQSDTTWPRRIRKNIFVKGTVPKLQRMREIPYASQAETAPFVQQLHER